MPLINTASTHDTVTPCAEVQSSVQHLIGSVNAHEELSLTNIILFQILGKTRKPLTPLQKQMLITTFEAKPFPEKVEIHQLAGLLNISKEKVDHWFRKKRCEGRQVGSKPMGK